MYAIRSYYGVDPGQFRPLFECLNKLLNRAGEPLRTAVTARLNVGLETARGTKTTDRRRVEHQPEAIAQPHAHAGEFLGQRLSPGGTLVPIRITSYNVCYTKLLRIKSRQ